MATTASGVTIPGSDPATTAATPIQDHWNNLGKSLNGHVIVPVASVTARAALIVALAAEGYTPTTSSPVFVFRADAAPGCEIEYTVNGTMWTTVTASSSSHLLGILGTTYDTPLSGTATWIALGNVTVPAWATRADVAYTLNGIYEPAGVSTVKAAMKIGAVAGVVDRRILMPGVTGQRVHVPITDTFVGLAAGVNAVTIAATWISGTGVIRADTTTFVTAQFTWRP